ncbi:MAG: hypothetical protein Q9190_005530 [Brigantiaea leucoxantha]
MPRLYSRIIIPFFTEAEKLDTATLQLRKSLARTIQEIPFLAWNVITSPEGQGRVALSPQLEDWSSIWRVKDLRSSDSETIFMQELQDKNFPMDQLDGELLAPLPVMADSQKPAPVFAAQLNILNGGILLCVAFHHSVLDASGFTTVLKTWANQSKVSEQADLDLAMIPRTIQDADLNREQISGNGWTGEASEFQEYSILEPQPEPEVTDSAPSQPFSLPSMTTTLFFFSSKSLIQLKRHVTKNITEYCSSSTWISTNDALCALLWQRISVARFTVDETSSSKRDGISAPPSHSMLGLAVNGRSKMVPPLPMTYLGNVNLYGTSRLPLHLVLENSGLGPMALSVRDAVTAINDSKIRQTISFIEQLPDTGLLIPGFKTFLGPDLAITSWADLGLNKLDWGQAVGNQADCIRLPNAHFDGLCIILPKFGDGGLEVMVGLKTEHMERLRKDEIFKEFAAIVPVR